MNFTFYNKCLNKVFNQTLILYLSFSTSLNWSSTTLSVIWKETTSSPTVRSVCVIFNVYTLLLFFSRMTCYETITLQFKASFLQKTGHI